MNPKEVQAVVSPYLEAGFFDLDMRAVHDAVSALPWVEQAQVRRRWPDGVIVHVREREPVARWRDNSLVTAEALVFSPPRATMPAGLPLLSGPETTERLMLQSLMHIGDMLAPAGLRVAAIRIDDRGAWSVELDTGMVMHLGRTQIEERLRRFSDITIPTLGDRLDQVAYVDLRYGSGFAVGWREKPPVPDMGEG
jgi:cell division protein FtsQ